MAVKCVKSESSSVLCSLLRLLLFAREAACNYHVKAQRLSGVHVSPDGSVENVCLSRKEHTVGQHESKYRLGSLRMSGGGSA